MDRLRRGRAAVAAVAALGLLVLALPAGDPVGALALDEGAAGLGLALRRLPVAGRVLYVTAHPDDENNAVLVALSRGRGLATALLTLTRGEGGQNAIGPELFEALGILRTEELAAVHRYDGAVQYFTAAYEFGFSFSVDETLEKWGHEATLEDVVRVVRSFRPDVILTLPLEAQGHQHHAAAARLAQEAFRAAADPGRFSGQVAEGLAPWQARKLYQGGLGRARPAVLGARTVRLATGSLDPLLGLSWAELGGLARSMHRSQSPGTLDATPGESEAAFVLVDSEPKVSAREDDILAGVDVSVRGLARFARGQAAAPAFLEADLEAIEDDARRALGGFDPDALERCLPPLRSGIERLRRLREDLLSGSSEASRHELLERLGWKEEDFLHALTLAHDLSFEVTVDDADVIPGQTFTVTAQVRNRGAEAVRIEHTALGLPAGWTQKRLAGGPQVLWPRGAMRTTDAVTVGETARFHQPYWRRQGHADRYEAEIPGHRGLPWSPPDVVATLRYTSGAIPVTRTRPAVWPWARGRSRKVVNVVPALSVSVAPEIAVLPLSSPRPSLEIRVVARSHLKAARAASIRLEVPTGWTATPREIPLQLRFDGDEAGGRFHVTPPARLGEGEFEVRAVAVMGGKEFRQGYRVIAYDHIEERHLFRPAAARVEAVDVRMEPGLSVGYVMGSGDDVPEAIRQLGSPVTLLGPADLASGDLSRYSTIVTGVRAYEVRGDLQVHHGRIIRYVEEGGNLLVQYNRSELDLGTTSPFTPYPARVSSGRIADEDAPVEVLAPASPVFQSPNAITARDWQGWVQERGIQLLEARDPRFTELLSATDPFPTNPGPKKGLLVEARVGKGTWTYVGLALFRQLPAGTPGAYRLLANLLSRPRGR